MSNNFINTLKNSSLFENINEHDISALLGCLGTKTKQYLKNEIIMSEGDSTREFGLVLSGSVQIIRIDYLGNRTILSQIAPTHLFAEAFACAGVVSLPLDVVATEDSEIMFIDSTRVLQSCCNACEFHNQIIYNLMKSIAEKNILFHQKLQITSKRSTREKLMEYLSQEARKQNSASFEIPYDRQALADYLEVDRSGLSAEISKLRKENIIASHKNFFRIL